MKHKIMQKVVEINKHKFLIYLFCGLHYFSIKQLHKFKTEMIGMLIENRKVKFGKAGTIEK